jgi:hypothetical protein
LLEADTTRFATRTSAAKALSNLALAHDYPESTEPTYTLEDLADPIGTRTTTEPRLKGARYLVNHGKGADNRTTLDQEELKLLSQRPVDSCPAETIATARPPRFDKCAVQIEQFH